MCENYKKQHGAIFKGLVDQSNKEDREIGVAICREWTEFYRTFLGPKRIGEKQHAVTIPDDDCPSDVEYTGTFHTHRFPNDHMPSTWDLTEYPYGHTCTAGQDGKMACGEYRYLRKKELKDHLKAEKQFTQCIDQEMKRAFPSIKESDIEARLREIPKELKNKINEKCTIPYRDTAKMILTKKKGSFCEIQL